MIKICLSSILLVLVYNTFAIADCFQLSPTGGPFGQSTGEADLGPLQLSDISINCDSEYLLGLDAGQNMLGSRRLHDSTGNYIPYYLWIDAGGGIEWGNNGLDGTPYPADPLSGIGDGAEIVHKVYATALTAGASPPGVYTDRINIILAYPPYGPENTLTGYLDLSLSLSGSCSLSTSGIHGFGEWSRDDGEVRGIELGSITVTCTAALNYRVGMSSGLNYLNGSRNMRFEAELMPYTLWMDSGATMEWGDQGLAEIDPDYPETYPSPGRNGTGTGAIQSYQVWGDAVIEGKRPGRYEDTVTVTIVWN